MIPKFDSIIIKLQKITRVDIQYLLSGGFFLSLSHISSAFIGLGLTIAFANLVSPEIYGTYKYVLAAYGLITIASLPGVDTAVMRAISHGHDKAFINGIKIKLRWSLVSSILALAYALYNFLNNQAELGIVFIIVALVIPIMESFILYISYFNAKKQYQTWSKIEIFTQLLSAASLLIAMTISADLITLILAYFLPNLVIRPIITYQIKKKINSESSTSKDLGNYAKAVSLFQIINRVILYIDQIVLFHFLGPAAVAVFSIANSLPSRLKGLTKITGSLAFPKFANKNGAELYQTLPRKMLLFGIIILLACVAYTLFVPILFTYVFPNYEASIAYSQALVFLAISGITYPYSSFLFAHKKLKENYILATGGFIVKVLCLVFLVPTYGIWGAVVGVVAAASVTVICTIYFLYQGRNDHGTKIDTGQASEIYGLDT